MYVCICVCVCVCVYVSYNTYHVAGNFIFLLSSNTPEEIKQFFGDSIDSLAQVSFDM